jgi:signal transduction histidine kinase
MRLRRISVRIDASPVRRVYRSAVRFSPNGRHAIDALIVLLAGWAQVEVWVDAEQTPRVVTTPAALLWTLPLLLRRRFPLGAPCFVFAVLAAEALVAGDAVTHAEASAIALIVCFGIVGSHWEVRSALIGAAVGYAAIATLVLSDHPALEGAVPVVVLTAVSWVIGRALGDRARRAADLEARAERIERTHEAAVAEERATIARELHDVIAHSVSVMTVQAGAARMLLDEDPRRARESLLAVEETGRQALGEMRRLLGILRGDKDDAQLAPQPGISDLDALVEHVRAAGLPVDVVVQGVPTPLPPGIDLAGYRVVQEALTNALKHAGAARAEVAICYSDTALEVAVTNDGHRARNGRVGHGLIGMRERVTLYGGEFHAGPRNGGGYVVRATLPLAQPS